MTRFWMILSLGFIAITASVGGYAQNVTGSTTIDVDQSTNTLVVTCETDVDDGDYKPSVQCALYDDSGHRVASQGYTPPDNAAYAEVVLTFTGTPGVTYTAIGSHVAICNITDLPEGGGPVHYDDPYNFEYFSAENGIYYPNYYDWYGPGPDTLSRNQTIRVGNTKATGKIKNVPTSLPVVGSAAGSIGPAQGCPAGYAGWRRLAIRQLTDQNGNAIIQAGQPITEVVHFISNALNLPPATIGHGVTDLHGQIGDRLDRCSPVCPSSLITIQGQVATDGAFPLGSYTIVNSCTSITVSGN